MPAVGFITEVELENLITDEVHREIAKLLNIQSKQRSCDLRKHINRIARAYDTGLIVAQVQPPKRSTKVSLARIQNAARVLSQALDEADGRAKFEVGHSLSLIRALLQLDSTEPMRPYNSIRANQAVFEKKSFHLLRHELRSIDQHITEKIQEFERPGPSKGPEGWAVRELMALSAVLNIATFRPSILTKISKLVLAPIAHRHGKSPGFDALIKQMDLVRDPPKEAEDL